ncbi:hypothetical protein QAD02_022260 [Eretmocerus hayati]|uniref:Uncharacterized protein n=1 Tax=Eretmocerus hayati TaxID=131215 RepID=A0ACC2PSG6_9HYME|nr:hypothetical protein QAD02_022260 [Eretmocerus hayati]
MEKTKGKYSEDLANLREQLFCCTPLNKFKWPESMDKFDDRIQRCILDLTINNKILMKYPIKHSYRRLFLKKLMSKLEQNDLDIHEDVYNTYCALLSSPSEEASSMHYRHFLFTNEYFFNLISIKESVSIISEGTTGLCSWKAALHLAEWCTFNHEKIRGKRVLELGSGVGLTGLTVLNYCKPKSYHFSDAHPLVLKTLEENVKLNLYDEDHRFLSYETLRPTHEGLEIFRLDPDIKVEIMKLEWEKIDDSLASERNFDLVIAADVLYDLTLFGPLATALVHLLNSTTVHAIIAATVRNESTITTFLTVLDKHDLAFEEETSSVPQLFIQHEETPVRIFKISRRNR